MKSHNSRVCDIDLLRSVFQRRADSERLNRPCDIYTFNGSAASQLAPIPRKPDTRSLVPRSQVSESWEWNSWERGMGSGLPAKVELG
ncbi:hypothetical protein AB1N83_014399 [Pleurotus pulmonarius]